MGRQVKDQTADIVQESLNRSRELHNSLSGLGEQISSGLIDISSAIQGLASDFHFLMGETLWELRLQTSKLDDILAELKLTETQREARAFRASAVDSYKNHWYDDALRDFLAAEVRNYKDHFSQISIGFIYLFRIRDERKALPYFEKAAKYARPVNPRHAALAHYYAGIVHAALQQPRAAIGELSQAVVLNAKLHEAHYQLASLAAFSGDAEVCANHLFQAALGDPRFIDKARSDPTFTSVIQHQKLKENVFSREAALKKGFERQQRNKLLLGQKVDTKRGSRRLP